MGEWDKNRKFIFALHSSSYKDFSQNALLTTFYSLPENYFPALASPKKKGTLFSAPSRAISFFFTLYIQDSIPRRVIGTKPRNLFLPRNQSLAAISRKMPS